MEAKCPIHRKTFNIDYNRNGMHIEPALFDHQCCGGITYGGISHIKTLIRLSIFKEFQAQFFPNNECTLGM